MAVFSHRPTTAETITTAAAAATEAAEEEENPDRSRERD